MPDDTTIPVLPTPLTTTAQTVTTPALNCPQVAIMSQRSAWTVKADGTLPLNAGGDPLVPFIVTWQPYDPLLNRCDPRLAQLNTQDVVGLGKGLAALGRPQLIGALLAQYAASADLIANGIPADLAKATRSTLIKTF